MVASYHDCVLLSKLKGFDITKSIYTSYYTKQAGVSIQYYEYHDHDDSEEEAEVELENVDLEAVNDAEDADITEVKRGDTEFWAARGKRAVNFWAPAHSWTLRGPRWLRHCDSLNIYLGKQF